LCYLKLVKSISGPLLAAACALLLACGSSGSTGDPISVPEANVYGSGQKLSDLLKPAHRPDNPEGWLDEETCAGMMGGGGGEPCEPDCSRIPPDQQADVTGVSVLAIDRFDETSSGARGNIYIQDSLSEPVPFSAITVFQPGFSPPDLRVVPGDVVDLLGFLTEFPGPSSANFEDCQTLPEMSGAMSFRFEGGGVPATTIDIKDLTDYKTARQWFGMLVTVDNITLLADPYESNGRVIIRIDAGVPGLSDWDAPEISNELFDLANYPTALTEGMNIKSVTGIVTFFFGIRIAPRGAPDIEL